MGEDLRIYLFKCGPLCPCDGGRGAQGGDETGPFEHYCRGGVRVWWSYMAGMRGRRECGHVAALEVVGWFEWGRMIQKWKCDGDGDEDGWWLLFTLPSPLFNFWCMENCKLEKHNSVIDLILTSH